MADYTILRNSEKDNRSDVIIEFPVPATSNTAGVGWQTVVAEIRAAEVDGPVTANPRKVDTVAYVAQLDAGELVEVPLSVEYNANLTDGQKVAVLDAAVAARVAAYTTEFVSLYNFYGTERTV